MSKHFTFSLMGMALVIFAGYILIAGNPLARIDRTCSPISWVGKAVSAASGIFSDSLAATMHNGAAQAQQGCRYVVFKTFYADEFAAAKREADADAAAHANSTSTPAHEPPPASAKAARR